MVNLVDLTPDEKKFCFSILSRTNPLLHKWAAKFPKIKFRQFRLTVLKNPSVLATELPVAEQTEFLADCAIIKEVHHIKPELNNRSVETAVFEGYSKMALHFAHKWAKNNAHRGLEREDYCQEGCIQIIDSMYGWLPCNNTSFSTYLYRSLHNRLNRVNNEQGSFLSHQTNESLRLVGLYNGKLNELGIDTPFETVVSELGLNPKEIKNLRASLIRVSNQSSDDTHSMGPAAWVDNSRATTIGRSSVQDPAQLVETNEFMSKVLKLANLNPLELDLIVSSMNPYHGWQTDVGERHNNTKGVPYQRMRVSQIYKAAKRKVERAILKLQS